MNAILEIPELRALHSPSSVIRIPDQINVPVTPRIRRLIDSAPFRRLAHIRQLGMVALVYPAATHHRFEHALGVYRLSLLYLSRLAPHPRFVGTVNARQATALLVTALLHDVGHWAYCHPLEDLGLAEIPRHELLATDWIENSEIAEILRRDFQLEPDDVLRLLQSRPQSQAERILCSILSGPIDVDKMDYLSRDSLHAGVPYGRNFDQQRLIDSLCLDEGGENIGISDKGKTAAELMVFARYVMFSEVYWHHAVRAATAMLQYAVYGLLPKLEVGLLCKSTDPEFSSALASAAMGTPLQDLVGGLFGPRRLLHKRAAEFGCFWQPELYERLARRPFAWLARCAGELARELSATWGTEIAASEVLIDSPPVHREIEFNIDVHFAKESIYRPLAEISPVVKTLATHQFDDYVKRARVFLSPRVQTLMQQRTNLTEPLLRAIEITDRTNH
jgi:HD superfamily phosphohydrolase